MSLTDKLQRLVGRGGSIRVRVLIRGRIGEGWLDIDQIVKLPPQSTLGNLIEASEKSGIPIKQALESSPHLSQTLMLNGERCPTDANVDRMLEDGDQVYLLAPLAGG